MREKELVEIIYRRRSIRRYEKRPVPDDVLNAVLEAGRLAPSASNLQPWHFIVVREPEIKRKLIFSTWNRFIDEAPIVIVGCGEADKKWAAIDVAIALENMVIAAEALGLGSCWIGHFREEEVKKALRIPGHLRVVAMITLGYPAERPRAPPKKKLEEILHYDGF
ncbi:MAG: nitroreductase family protein [Aigarchaeota archaeon]|nr:nitroreductase family protein [Aigarchaeota archaeon]